MTYRINKTDGNILADIPDGTFDTASSSLTLIGKNVTNFGEVFNENLVKLLENFSSSTAPEHPIKGQLWYNTSTGRLNVYDGSSFRASGGPLISSTRPLNLVPGDLWINNDTNQLWFYDGVDLVLAGPSYTSQQGRTGFIVDSIVDSSNRLKVITKLLVNNVLLGIFSNTAFTPALPIEGFSGPIGIGFTAGTLTGLRFNVTASKAESLITALGDVKVADDILYNNEDGTIVGSLSVQSVDGIRVLGGDPGTNTTAQGDTYLKLESGDFVIENNESSRAIDFRIKKPIGGITSAIYIDAVNQRVGFFNRAPSSTVDITGDLKISGNLIIQGDSFTINTTSLAVEDKNIELNVVENGFSTDGNADGGGITLHGTTDKTITYNFSYGSWDSSENFNLPLSKSFTINHLSVLSASTLGTGVVNSNLQTFGNITTLNMSNGLNLTGNTITGRNADLVLTSDTGDISANGKLIKNLGDLNYFSSPLSSAANKKYVDERVSARPLTLSIDISDFNVFTQNGMDAANNKILEILKYTASIYDGINNPQGVAIVGTLAKVHASHTAITISPIQYRPIQSGLDEPGPTETVAFSKTTVNKGVDNYENWQVVEDIILEQVIPPPTASVTVTRFYKRFEVKQQPDTSLAWEFVTDYTPVGAWVSGGTYSLKDLVIYNSREYICISPISGSSSTPAANGTNWQLFALI